MLESIDVPSVVVLSTVDVHEVCDPVCVTCETTGSVDCVNVRTVDKVLRLSNK